MKTKLLLLLPMLVSLAACFNLSPSGGNSQQGGETFPYKITFTAMSAERATVKIELA